ncbi:hypothetical protein LZ31DRAFT_560524 [Colletotrichum somersetense]|nr:hypothetical protein LZ31DRAFT_560524 [Colletotrichum somersetense]
MHQLSVVHVRGITYMTHVRALFQPAYYAAYAVRTAYLALLTCSLQRRSLHREGGKRR